MDHVTIRLVDFGHHVPEFPGAIFAELTAIYDALLSIQSALESSGGEMPRFTKRLIADVELICSVLQIVSGSVNEIFLQADGTDLSVPSEDAKHQTIWDEYNLLLNSTHGMDLRSLLGLCQDFVRGLEDIIVHSGNIPDDMNTMRLRLSSYRQESRGEGDQGLRTHFDTVLYRREFEREAEMSEEDRIGNVKVHVIPSLLRLYQLGELEFRPTFATPNSSQLSTVCLIRHDITRLEVDVIVNTTDPGFSGMGMLDRTVFRKGGVRMNEECSKFGLCEEVRSAFRH